MLICQSTFVVGSTTEVKMVKPAPMKHWRWRVLPSGWLELESPTFQKNKGGQTELGVIREMYAEWKIIETQVAQSKLSGWVCNTKYDNWPMISFITTAGAFPFLIDKKKKSIWFRKPLAEN